MVMECLDFIYTHLSTSADCRAAELSQLLLSSANSDQSGRVEGSVFLFK